MPTFEALFGTTTNNFGAFTAYDRYVFCNYESFSYTEMFTLPY